jgi:hypothetical protein
MARVKVSVTVKTYGASKAGEFARAWVSQDVANNLSLAAGEWIYLSKDWIGVLSTQALVEGVVSDSGASTVLLSPDRMKDAHFKEGDSPKAWKLTEWE